MFTAHVIVTGAKKAILTTTLTERTHVLSYFKDMGVSQSELQAVEAQLIHDTDSDIKFTFISDMYSELTVSIKKMTEADCGENALKSEELDNLMQHLVGKEYAGRYGEFIELLNLIDMEQILSQLHVSVTPFKDFLAEWLEINELAWRLNRLPMTSAIELMRGRFHKTIWEGNVSLKEELSLSTPLGESLVKLYNGIKSTKRGTAYLLVKEHAAEATTALLLVKLLHSVGVEQVIILHSVYNLFVSEYVTRSEFEKGLARLI